MTIRIADGHHHGKPRFFARDTTTGRFRIYSSEQKREDHLSAEGLTPRNSRTGDDLDYYTVGEWSDWKPKQEPIEPIPPKPGFETATGLFQRGLWGEADTRNRWIVLDKTTNYWKAFGNPREAEMHMRGVPATSTGEGSSVETAERCYHNVIWYSANSTDYEAEYVNLVDALRGEAERRNWCPEWERFARDAGVPEELIKPKHKVRVTVELTIDPGTGWSDKRVVQDWLRAGSGDIIDIKEV